MTNQFRAVIHKNTWLAREAERTGGGLESNTEATRQAAAARVRIKPAGPGVKSRKRSVEKYEGRKNTCGVHGLQKAVGTGECPMCE